MLMKLRVYLRFKEGFPHGRPTVDPCVGTGR